MPLKVTVFSEGPVMSGPRSLPSASFNECICKTCEKKALMCTERVCYIGEKKGHLSSVFVSKRNPMSGYLNATRSVCILETC